MNKLLFLLLSLLSFSAFSQTQHPGFSYCDRSVKDDQILYIGREKAASFIAVMETPTLTKEHTLNAISFPSDIDDPDGSIVVLNQDSVAMFIQPIKIKKGWNTYKVTNSLKLPAGKKYFVGFRVYNDRNTSFVVPFDNRQEHCLPQATLVSIEELSSTFGLNQKPMELKTHVHRRVGTLMLVLDIDGPDTENAAYVSFINGTYVGDAKSTETLRATVRNIGTKPLWSLQFGFSDTMSQTAETVCNIKSGEIGEVPFNYTLPEKGTYLPSKITLTHTNKVPNLLDKFSIVRNFSALTEGGAFRMKDIFIEGFTTEICGWCPAGKPHIEKSIEVLKENGFNVSYVSHHTGYKKDWLTLDGSADLKRHVFNIEDGSFAPGIAFNRYNCGTANACVMGVSDITPATILELTKVYLQFGEIKTFSFSREKGFKVSGYVTNDVDKDNVFLHIIVCENNIDAKKQLGAKGKYTHMAVARAFNGSFKGQKIQINDDRTFSIELPPMKFDESWKQTDMYAVCFISGDMGAEYQYDKKRVYASKTGVLLDPESVIEIAENPVDIKVEGRQLVIKDAYERLLVFDMAGRLVQLSNNCFPQDGVYIVSVKTANGVSNQKVVVK